MGLKGCQIALCVLFRCLIHLLSVVYVSHCVNVSRPLEEEVVLERLLWYWDCLRAVWYEAS